MPLRYYLVNESNLAIEESEIVTNTVNLSGGGVLILAKNKLLPIGTKLWIEIDLYNNENFIKTLAVVNRVNIRKDSDGTRFFYMAIQFIGLEEADRKKIINFLNVKVIEEKNRGFL